MKALVSTISVVLVLLSSSDVSFARAQQTPPEEISQDISKKCVVKTRKTHDKTIGLTCVYADYYCFEGAQPPAEIPFRCSKQIGCYDRNGWGTESFGWDDGSCPPRGYQVIHD